MGIHSFFVFLLLSFASSCHASGVVRLYSDDFQDPSKSKIEYFVQGNDLELRKFNNQRKFSRPNSFDTLYRELINSSVESVTGEQKILVAQVYDAGFQTVWTKNKI